MGALALLFSFVLEARPAPRPAARKPATALAKTSTVKKAAALVVRRVALQRSSSRVVRGPLAGSARLVAIPVVTGSPVTLMRAFAAPATGTTIENPRALVPFFERLYRSQASSAAPPVHILQFGDSHTASDDWVAAARARFQQTFGAGGPGFSHVGHPYLGYRRFDVRGGNSSGWVAEGTVNHTGDGMHGLSGVSLSTMAPLESVYLEAEADRLELYFLRQPGGGDLELRVDGFAVEQFSTAGETAPGFLEYKPQPGPHRFEVVTTQRAPVRLFGWVTENERGVTYETLGINGATAPLQLNWNQAVFQAHVARRQPALIVLAYGTNEASSPSFSPASYRGQFQAVLERIRQAAPSASILVVGPPDRYWRIGRQWAPLTKVAEVIAVQREVALANGCAFWDVRARMGGNGAMPRWVAAGLAQRDYAHLTGTGYRLLGDTLYDELMGQYRVFVSLRQQMLGQSTEGQEIIHGQANENHLYPANGLP